MDFHLHAIQSKNCPDNSGYITSQNETSVDSFQPTCSICTFELFKLGPDSLLRGYAKPEQRLSGMDRVIHPDRYRDRTAIDFITGCGHLAHVSCLNLHFGQRLAIFMEEVHINSPNATPPLPKCGCGQIISNNTQKACFPGYEEKKILLNSPQIEKPHVESTGSENSLEIEVLRVLEMGGGISHLHVNHINFQSEIHDTSISISHPRNWVSSLPTISEAHLVDFITMPAKTRAVSHPSPFFNQNSISGVLHDNYNGEYVDLATQVMPSFPVFIFYYAPWDADSVAARGEFFRVAKHFQVVQPNTVKFYAVNCWWTDGQCRQNYKNLSHYPILVIHVASYLGIIYNGPLRAELMTRFISSALKPFSRLDTEEELWRFRAEHDTVVLAYFNFTEPRANQAYETYRQMALRNLEADPFGQVGFGVFLKAELAAKYFLTSSNAISLMLFNEIHTAKWVGSYHEKDKGPVGQVTDWILERTKTIPVTWIYPLRNGFSNRPVALGHSDLSQELWKGPVFLLVTKRYYPSAYSPFYTQLKEVALDYFNCNKSGNVTKLRHTTHKINTEWMNLWKSVHRICKMSKVRSATCDIMWEQLSDWEERKSAFKKVPLNHYEALSKSLNFTGFSCESKRPFRFLVVDPTDIPHFLELALGQRQSGSETFRGTNVDPLAFIIDAQNELLLPFTSFNISELAHGIYNFTLQVESGDNKVPSNRLWVEESKLTRQVIPRTTIRKFNSEELLDFLDSPESPLFLLYTAKFCGYCGVMLSHFVRLENFLGNYNLNITLAKIDAFKNSLPATLSPESIPSFVFYPADRNADSRLFPKGESMTTQSLLRFLLSELDSETRVELSLQTETCRKTGNISKDKCVVQNRERVTEQIHSVLKRLRQSLGLSKHTNESISEINSVVWENEGDFFSQSMNVWKNELLDHLRAVKLSLDLV